MSTYFNIEKAIQDLIVEKMPDRYPAPVVRRGDIDGAFENAFKEFPEDPRFCVLNHEGGYVDPTSITFNSPLIWRHRVYVDFYVPLKGARMTQEMEDDVRFDYDAFLTEIGAFRRCLGGNRRLTVTKAWAPETFEVEQQSYVRTRFVVEILEPLQEG
jgi:hypothetical protein